MFNTVVSFIFTVVSVEGEEKGERENERSLGHWFHSALCYLHTESSQLLRDSYHVVLHRVYKFISYGYVDCRDASDEEQLETSGSHMHYR